MPAARLICWKVSCFARLSPAQVLAQDPARPPVLPSLPHHKSPAPAAALVLAAQRLADPLSAPQQPHGICLCPRM